MEELINEIGIKMLDNLEIKRTRLAYTERKIIEKAIKEYHFNESILLDACEQAKLLKNGFVNFGHVETILKDWYDKSK